MEDTYPNSVYLLVLKLSTYLQESDLPSQSDHLFEGDKLNKSSTSYSLIHVASPKTFM
jgi:hypothetical protein